MLVKIHYLFSRNNKIGSKVISWGTSHLSKNKSPSHAALLIHNRWVFEAIISGGVKVTPYSKWLDINIEVAKIPSNFAGVEYAHIKKIFKDIQNKKYDWFGLVYLGLKLALNKWFGSTIPLINKWQDSDKYFCSEAVGKLTNKDYSMKAPVQIMDELIK